MIESSRSCYACVGAEGSIKATGAWTQLARVVCAAGKMRARLVLLPRNRKSSCQPWEDKIYIFLAGISVNYLFFSLSSAPPTTTMMNGRTASYLYYNCRFPARLLESRFLLFSLCWAHFKKKYPCVYFHQRRIIFYAISLYIHFSSTRVNFFFGWRQLPSPDEDVSGRSCTRKRKTFHSSIMDCCNSGGTFESKKIYPPRGFTRLVHLSTSHSTSYPFLPTKRFSEEEYKKWERCFTTKRIRERRVNRVSRELFSYDFLGTFVLYKILMKMHAFQDDENCFQLWRLFTSSLLFCS